MRSVEADAPCSQRRKQVRARNKNTSETERRTAGCEENEGVKRFVSIVIAQMRHVKAVTVHFKKFLRLPASREENERVKRFGPTVKAQRRHVKDVTVHFKKFRKRIFCFFLF